MVLLTCILLLLRWRGDHVLISVGRGLMHLFVWIRRLHMLLMGQCYLRPIVTVARLQALHGGCPFRVLVAHLIPHVLHLFPLLSIAC